MPVAQKIGNGHVTVLGSLRPYNFVQYFQVYATLVEYRTTGERQPINFTEAAYEDTYRNHMKSLAETRVYAPKALGRVLHRLYLETTETKSAQSSAGSSATLINLVDIPGADA
ncbi:hypothetical protein B0H14DRAFT_3486785 [Mycena olivaceomarginata]|nr:hypothetical protein B0H14DRAFT_3486785 [Mycena olivaceomarginata]